MTSKLLSLGMIAFDMLRYPIQLQTTLGHSHSIVLRYGDSLGFQCKLFLSTAEEPTH